MIIYDFVIRRCNIYDDDNDFVQEISYLEFCTDAVNEAIYLNTSQEYQSTIFLQLFSYPLYYQVRNVTH